MSLTLTAENIDAVKVILIGDAGVGKTCIITRLLDDSFVSKSSATLSASFLRKEIDGCSLQIWDTAGQERFRALAPLYYHNSFAIVIVFDITQILTFESVSFWINDIKTKYGESEKPFIYLVANKADLSQEVQQQVIDEFLKQNVEVIYYKVSALSGLNINVMFKEIVQKYKDQKYLRSKSKRKINWEEKKQRKDCCSFE